MIALGLLSFSYAVYTPAALADAEPWTGIPPGAAEKPVGLTVPSLDIKACVREVGLDSSGDMALPTNWRDVGWYRGSAQPGDWGPPPAVISGHVDHYTGPAVFFKLKQLQPGDQVVVTGQAGTKWRFRVVEKRIKPLRDWGAREVFSSPAHFPTLHLFSCTGAYSRSAKTHLARILVRCELEEVIPSN